MMSVIAAIYSVAARMDAMQREVDEKRHIYETQEFSRADVERINRNKQTLIRQKDLLEKENADLDQQIWEKEIQITKEQEKVIAEIRFHYLT